MLVNRNIRFNGRRTSVRLEPPVWDALSEICSRQRTTLGAICAELSACKPKGTSLTAALRVFVMAYFRAAATEDGHQQAGHGAGWEPEAIPRLVNHIYLSPGRSRAASFSQKTLNKLLAMLDDEDAAKLQTALAVLHQLPRDHLN
jgi:predicted DNA-binding ribbon-helix-helix protein